MALLSTHALTAHYGDFQALFGIDIELNQSETIAIIGANGAGKTTLMRAISGILTSSAASIKYENHDIGALSADEIMSLGIAMVPEGRKLFSSLSVEENLIIGTYGRSPQPNDHWRLDTIYELFPALKDLRKRPGPALSGGQQQMVAIGRALMSNPKVLLCDEISLGLAPVIIRDIYKAVPAIQQAGASIVVVEQDIGQAMQVADRVYCMMEGRVTLSGTPDELSREAIHNAYFGETE